MNASCVSTARIAPALAVSTLLASLVLLTVCAPRAAGALLITEVNSNGSGGDFFEIYNYGTTTIDLAGYLWTDNTVPSFSGSNTYTLNSFSVAPQAAVVIVADSGQNGAGNAGFLTNWGTSSPPVNMGGFAGPIPANPALTGRGLGQNDAVLLWDPSGTFVSGVNYGTSNLTVTSSGGTSILAPFNRVSPPGGSSAGGHAGAAGGGAAAVSLIWDPTSPFNAPLYTSATSVGLYDAFANATSPSTIGSPGIVPEPSSVALALVGGTAAGWRLLRRRRRPVGS